MCIIEWTSIFYWIFSGVWQPFAIYTLAAIPYTVRIIRYYRSSVSYICPQCRGVFKPLMKEFIFAPHTMTTRRLSCTCCGHNGFCVETGGAELTRGS